MMKVLAEPPLRTDCKLVRRWGWVDDLGHSSSQFNVYESERGYRVTMQDAKGNETDTLGHLEGGTYTSLFSAYGRVVACLSDLLWGSVAIGGSQRGYLIVDTTKADDWAPLSLLQFEGTELFETYHTGFDDRMGIPGGASQRESAAAPPLSDSARKIVDESRRFHQKLYEDGKAAGLSQIKDGPLEWCKLGLRMWRVHLTEDYASLMRSGPGTNVYEALVQSRADMNGISIELASQRTAEERRVLVEPSRPSDLLRMAMAEITSPFAKEPDWIQVVGGTIHRICVTDPVTYLQLVMERTSKLLGFLNSFGRTDDGALLGSMAEIYMALDQMVERVRLEGGDHREAVAQVRSVLGVQPERYVEPRGA